MNIRNFAVIHIALEFGFVLSMQIGFRCTLSALPSTIPAVGLSFLKLTRVAPFYSLNRKGLEISIQRRKLRIVTNHIYKSRQSSLQEATRNTNQFASLPAKYRYDYDGIYVTCPDSKGQAARSNNRNYIRK